MPRALLAINTVILLFLLVFWARMIHMEAALRCQSTIAVTCVTACSSVERDLKRITARLDALESSCCHNPLYNADVSTVRFFCDTDTHICNDAE